MGWTSVLSELKSRCVADVCIVCCDGLTGLPGAISVTSPQAVVQLCEVRLIHASLRYACSSRGVDRHPFGAMCAPMMRPLL
jgi:putative transposase